MDARSSGLRQSRRALGPDANLGAERGCRIALSPGLLDERLVAAACRDLSATVAWATGRAAVVLREAAGTEAAGLASATGMKSSDTVAGERGDSGGEAGLPPLKSFSILLWKAEADAGELAVLLQKRRLRRDGFAVDSLPGTATLVRARDVEDSLAGLYWLIESVRFRPEDLLSLSARKRSVFKYRVFPGNAGEVGQPREGEDALTLRALADGYSHRCYDESLPSLRASHGDGEGRAQIPNSRLGMGRSLPDRINIQYNEYEDIQIRSEDEVLTVVPCTVGIVPRSRQVNSAFEGEGDRLIGEVRLCRLEEGGGVFPAWMGCELAHAFQVLSACHAAGVLVWFDGSIAGEFPRGDSPDTFWNDANLFLARSLLREPNADPGEIARRWATIRFGPRAANDIAELLALSESTMERFRHFGCESRQDQCPPSFAEDGHIPLDDYSRLMQVYGEFRDRVEALIDRKREAVGLVDRMIGLVERNREPIAEWKPPPRLAFEMEWPEGLKLVETVLASLRACRHLVAAERDVVAAVFQYFQRLEDPSTGPSALSVVREIEGFNRDWSLFSESMEGLPRTGAVFSNSGIQEALDCVRLDMDQETIPSFEWWVCGPLPNWNNEGFDHPFPPERRVVLSERFFSDGQEWGWSRLPDFALREGVVDFGALYGGREWATAYAYTEIECDKTLAVELRVGSDDGIKVWINGELVHANDAGRPVRLDDDIQPTALPKGINRILVKNTNRILSWGFCLRFTDETGRTLAEARPRFHLDSGIS